MRVLLIGGTRFVGYQLAWRLLAAGHRLTLLNRGTHADPFGDRVERLTADRTAVDLNRLLAGREFDATVDFAAYTAADARQAVDAGGRLGHYVFISTGQVYLVRENDPRPAAEADYQGPVMAEPSDPVDREEWLYGVRKRDAEDLLAAAPDFPSTRLRIPMVNGERDHYRRIEGYLWRILDGGPVLLPDGGRNVCRHVYSGDVVKAVADLLGRPETFGQAYNLCQREVVTLENLVATLAGLLGAPARLAPVPAERLVAAGLRPVDVSPFSDRWMSVLDPSLAERELGFRHESLERYLDKVVTAFLSHPPAAPPPGYGLRSLETPLA